MLGYRAMHGDHGRRQDGHGQLRPFPHTYSLTTTASPVEGGTVTPSGTETYHSGTQVTVSVSPTSGYVFTGWTGACDGTGSCVVTMDADKTVTATLTIVQDELPNLEPFGLVAPSSASQGDHIILEWTVRNSGSTLASRSTDVVRLVAPGIDQKLVTHSNRRILPGRSTHSHYKKVTIP